MSLTDFRNKLKVIEQFDIEAETIEIIKDNSKFLTELLKSQLQRGKNADKEPILLSNRRGVNDFYSDRTIWEKEHHGVGLGKVTDWITNYMSGHFYANMRVVTEGTDFLFESDVPYFSDILAQNTQRAFELDIDNLHLFRDTVVVPELRRRFSEVFNGV